MNKFFSTLLLAMVCAMTAWADELVSGEYYRICSADGTSALSNGGSASNNVVLRMCAVDADDQGQVWQLTESNGYWQIKSAVGNVCIDNPSESHASWSNQVLQWQTSGGNNQKWKFEAADEDFYMIPYESVDGSKSYGYDSNGYVTYQAKGADNTRFLLKRVSSEPLKPLQLNGYYTLQPVSVYPDFNFKSEGRFLSFSEKGTCSLAEEYVYNTACLKFTTDAEGVLRITLPHRGEYVYSTGSGLKSLADTNDSKLSSATFALYADDERITPDTRLALTLSTAAPTGDNSSVRAFMPSTSGTSISLQSKSLVYAQCYRLISIPAGEAVAELAQALTEANALLPELAEDQATALGAAISLAQSECDYPYLTPAEAASQTAQLKEAVALAKSSSAASSTKPTGIGEAETKVPVVDVRGGRITVSGADHVRIYNTAGQSVQQGTVLSAGVYVVVADGVSMKVAL